MNTETKFKLESWLWQGCGRLAIALALYFASVGPAYRLHAQQVLPRGTLALYRPIAGLKSPFFKVTFQYILLWM